ncbi:MAG: hypothetical protein WC655_01585 [Candidatus Hydrogenedentales bacterium]|jgi:hypothetical protein
MKLSSLAILFLGVALAAPAIALDVPLTYAAYPAQQNEFHPFGAQHIQTSQTVPAGEWKLPPLVAKVPLYGLAEFGDKKFLMVLDYTAASDKFYSRLLFDANANSDLTDDPVLEGKSTMQSNGQYVTVEIKQAAEFDVMIGDAKVRYSFRPQVHGWFQSASPDMSKPENLQNVNFYLRTNCSYTGEFDHEGAHYRVELGDRNTNGRFDDIVKVPTDMQREDRLYGVGDGFYITTDSKNDYYNEMSLGDKLVLGESVFQVRISTPESKLTLTPITENLSSIRIPMAVERIVLVDSEFKNGIMMFRPGKVAKVPEGEYRMMSYQVLRNDKEGDLWRLNAMGSKKTEPASVKKGSSAVLALGEPYRPLVEIPEWARSNMQSGAKEVQISFEIRGKGGEMVSDLSRIQGNKSKIPMSAKNGSRPKEPTYKIVKKDGEVAKQGQFEYG